jgi:hypothetical protein
MDAQSRPNSGNRNGPLVQPPAENYADAVREGRRPLRRRDDDTIHLTQGCFPEESAARGAEPEQGARKLGTATRHFIADERGGLSKLSKVRWEGAFFRNERLLEYAGRDLKMIDVTVEVHGHHTERVLRILPTRVPILSDGRVDVEGFMKLSFRQAGLVSRRPVDPYQQIAKLEADANYFWEMEVGHWRALSRMLGVPTRVLRELIYQPPTYW